jgi:hypothetical protein
LSERSLLVEALVAEVLGPRSGALETLGSDQDPLDEYIVGVLAPFTAPSIEVDSEEELVGDQFVGADDDQDPGEPVPGQTGGAGSQLPSLTLDPRARPSSMGLSFAIASPGPPRLDLVATWARYNKDSSGSWQRRPHGSLWRGVDCSRGPILAGTSDPEVQVRLRSRREPGGTWRVSIFLVNSTHVRPDRRPAAAEHVFQPQIRVRCTEEVDLVPLERQHPSQDEEDEGLTLLYSQRPVLARGHLCSAVWRAVDPERPHPSGGRGEGPPFRWLDGAHLFDGATVSAFEPADVRSEFVPVVPVNAPAKQWPAEHGAPPELDPENLAELSQGEVRSRLMPIVDAYERWIEGERHGAGSPAPATAAHRHLAECSAAASRMNDGIDLLTADTDALQAFCFANKAIALQSRWVKGRVNPWWPFQLGFQLVNLRGIVDATHPDRQVCDLLWFPTGGGKTEAYLGLAAFTLAYRRLRAKRTHREGAGVAVLSRYTLRLLTIQQYRRAVALVTACELLRVSGSQAQRGWRPAHWSDAGDLPWGDSRFSVGLWVGGSVTPNNIQDFEYLDENGRPVHVHGAISILEGSQGEGEPAQILSCPACSSILAVPPEGVHQGETATLHLVIGDPGPQLTSTQAGSLSFGDIQVLDMTVTPHPVQNFATVGLRFRATADVTAQAIDTWFTGHLRRAIGSGSWLVPARASRPGYFVRVVDWGRRRTQRPVDFEIYCPDPDCELNRDVRWTETRALGPWPAFPAFDRGDGTSCRCPVPAWTVDDQVYAHCPSMVVATVDKFARLAFEPRAASLFGTVDSLNEHLGYYRAWAPPLGPASLPDGPRQDPAWGRNVRVEGFDPPDVILQDELHLIEGPLGSMVGIYEAGVDLLATGWHHGQPVKPKYLASTATVRHAGDQVRSLFDRGLAVFPPPGITAEETFFSTTGTSHPLDEDEPGRLYVGMIAPGRGAQTPIVRIWSRLLQTPLDRRGSGATDGDLDRFWTLVGYFNAIRELAGAVALARQDIIQRLGSIAANPRQLEAHEPMELSSRANSMELPGMLDQLSVSLGSGRDPSNVVVTTSMFGTGVDIERLGLMVVHGQPKTTSAYIQATGRVGRQKGGLVVAFYRAARPRDLSYYEYFTGYHSTFYRYVEPVTVNPFAPRARDRALGPVSVSILRQARDLPGGAGPVSVHERWRVEQRLAGRNWYCRAEEMTAARTDPDVDTVPNLLELRAASQPILRRPPTAETGNHAHSELDRWQQLATMVGGRLLYSEPTVTHSATRPVVLGDLAHTVARTGLAYENAPNSLREVEATVTIRGRQ